MRAITLFALSALLVTAGAAGQTSTTLVTDTDVGVFASTTLKAAKKGTAIVAGRPLALSVVVRGA